MLHHLILKCNRSRIVGMRHDHRSTCPISTALEVVGDRWTLLVLRDLMFAGKRHFRQLLQSEEGISSNVLADRLNMLVEQELVRREDDPSHAQKAIYSLTGKGLDLLPVMIAMSAWAQKHHPETRRPEAVDLVGRSPKQLERLLSQLRDEHGV
ncbi:MAG: putative transcriptional regulator protein HxlR family [Ramlibacter sp.]|jgi:DNA-binding HxlR family transcriptional regulator|nr:putative transcriptional regulator protein HxlR family [Ramlibacter sp.]